MSTAHNIISYLPFSKPFLFVDTLEDVDENSVKGSYKFHKDADFYKGHFKDNPITPGVLLTECCAQIGLVCLGIFLLQQENEDLKELQIGLSSSEMEFFLPVYPDETVTVSSEKVYFRFSKLKCKVKMYNAKGKVVCQGALSGMLKNTNE